MTAKRKPYSSQMGADIYMDRKYVAKKFVTQKEGSELYSLGIETFRKMAEEAGAVYRLNKLILVNTEVFEEYLETFRVWR